MFHMLTKYGDFPKLNLEVVRHPLFEVPYPHLKRGQQTLGALVAVVRSNRYMHIPMPYLLHKTLMVCA